MNLYLVESQEVEWDTCVGIVVAAETSEEARNTSPLRHKAHWHGDVSKLEVTLLGSAKPGTKPGIILQSDVYG